MKSLLTCSRKQHLVVKYIVELAVIILLKHDSIGRRGNLHLSPLLLYL